MGPLARVLARYLGSLLRGSFLQPSDLLPPVESTTLKGKLVRGGLKHTGLPESMIIKRY